MNFLKEPWPPLVSVAAKWEISEGGTEYVLRDAEVSYWAVLELELGRQYGASRK